MLFLLLFRKVYTISCRFILPLVLSYLYIQKNSKIKNVFFSSLIATCLYLFEMKSVRLFVYFLFVGMFM